MIVTLESHDYSPVNHNLGLLEEIHSHYPSCKLTVFCVPAEARFTKKAAILSASEYKPFVAATKKAIKQGWLEVGVHGLTHAPNDFGINRSKKTKDFDYFKIKLMMAENIFKKAGLPFVKLFVAPFWQLHPEAKRAIESKGYRVIEESDHNWNLRDDFPNLPINIGHTHIQNTCGNGLEESLPRILQIPTSAKWKFLSEILNEKTT